MTDGNLIFFYTFTVCGSVIQKGVFLLEKIKYTVSERTEVASMISSTFSI